MAMKGSEMYVLPLDTISQTRERHNFIKSKVSCHSTVAPKI